MPSISRFCSLMTYWCDEGNLGYDQSNRWDIRIGGETDCSALVIHCLREAGFDTGNATYTGNLSAALTARGWRRLAPTIATCQPGDILLNDANHVCAVVKGYGWNATIAQASIDEHGRATGGQAGDQTGRETLTRPVYTYSRGWDCILRWTGASSSTPSSTSAATSKLAVDGEWGKATTRAMQKSLGTEVDGIVSGQLRSCRRYLLTDAGAFEWNDGGGSAMMRALQQRLSVAADGYIGPTTIKAYQRKLGVEVDGWCGKDTTKAIQRALNRGALW